MRLSASAIDRRRLNGAFPMLMPIVVPFWCGETGIPHGFFTRKGGVSQGVYESLNCSPFSEDFPGHVVRNRALVADFFGISSSHLITARQCHSCDVAVVTKAECSGAGVLKVDALVTAEPGVAVGVLTADCAPVLLVDRVGGIVGAVHAGREGALLGVIEATIREMERLGAHRERIKAAIGPCISAPCYEVDRPCFEAALEKDPGCEGFFSSNGLRFFFDLPCYVRARLGESGVYDPWDCGLCTYQDPYSFFSYRKNTHEGHLEYGRQISIVMLPFF